MEGFEEDSDGNCSRSGVSGDFSLGPPQSCTDPVEGFARLSEQAADRGLDLIIEAETEAGPCNFVPGALASQDMDGDGDVDLLFNDPEGFPLIYAYQDGRFSRGPAGPEVSAPFGRPVLSFGTADLDGDSLPEVVVVGESLALLSWNLGELGFSDWRPTPAPASPAWASVTWTATAIWTWPYPAWTSWPMRGRWPQRATTS